MVHSDPLLPDTRPPDETAPLDNIERVGGHGGSRDLARHDHFDGRTNVHDRPDVHVDPETGRIVRPHISAGMEDGGMENGEFTEATRVVNQNAPEYNALRIPAVKNVPVQLLGEDARRGYTRIANDSTNTDPVLVGTLPMVQAGQGFLLSPGQAYEPTTILPVFAMLPASAAGTSATVSVWAERHP